MEIVIWIIVGGFLGGGIGYGLYALSYSHAERKAEIEANDLVSEKRSEAELLDLELAAQEKEIVEEIELSNREFFEQLEPRIEELTDRVEQSSLAAKENRDLFFEKRKKAESLAQSAESHFKNTQKLRTDQLEKIKFLRQNLVSKVVTEKSLDLNSEKAGLEQRFLDEEVERLRGRSAETVTEIQNNFEFIGKSLIDRAIYRFQRSACPERGIASVHFENPNQRSVLTDEVAQWTQTLVGCDIYLDAESDLIGVSGFDPVRRELARRVLEKLKKEKKKPDQARVDSIFQNEKRTLLQAIQKDGRRIAQELQMKNFHPEIEQMLGSLRYRYSFTQNQHFHCGEVGFLSGLLASEMGVAQADLQLARRSGLLHDIGKAMDHEQEGGHAMIGANFIEARKEARDVVHAVRSHHFDETPATEYAFLVIGADAISGSRPGARRSTVETYNQKVSDMVSIAESYPGVTECLVLSGGRECRVWVNSSKVSDAGALKLGQEITKRIETELSYPGQIKVVIVRQTLVSEQTRHA